MEQAAQISIVVNGETKAVDSNTSLFDLLRILDINHSAIAVELNSEIATKASFETTWLADGDVVEVVSLVGGG